MRDSFTYTYFLLLARQLMSLKYSWKVHIMLIQLAVIFYKNLHLNPMNSFMRYWYDQDLGRI